MNIAKTKIIAIYEENKYACSSRPKLHELFPHPPDLYLFADFKTMLAEKLIRTKDIHTSKNRSKYKKNHGIIELLLKETVFMNEVEFAH